MTAREIWRSPLHKAGIKGSPCPLLWTPCAEASLSPCGPPGTPLVGRMSGMLTGSEESAKCFTSYISC